MTIGNSDRQKIRRTSFRGNGDSHDQIRFFCDLTCDHESLSIFFNTLKSTKCSLPRLARLQHRCVRHNSRT
jgi:hypothetical protein